MFDTGPWRDGLPSDAIVADGKNAEAMFPDENDEYYGGLLIAESVAPWNKPLIKAAPDLVRLLAWAMEWLAIYAEPDHPNVEPEFRQNFDEAMRLVRLLDQ